ncbi:hypothetical protein GGI04_005688, partial [Coemansia thaxteri]
ATESTLRTTTWAIWGWAIYKLAMCSLRTRIRRSSKQRKYKLWRRKWLNSSRRLRTRAVAC